MPYYNKDPKRDPNIDHHPDGDVLSGSFGGIWERLGSLWLTLVAEFISPEKFKLLILRGFYYPQKFKVY